jgi:hypothetical protein
MAQTNLVDATKIKCVVMWWQVTTYDTMNVNKIKLLIKFCVTSMSKSKLYIYGYKGIVEFWCNINRYWKCNGFSDLQCPQLAHLRSASEIILYLSKDEACLFQGEM